MSIEKIEENVIKKTPTNFQKDMKECITYAEKEYKEQKRFNGDPLITHGLAIAETLLENEMDTNTAMAAILHEIPLETLEKSQIPQEVIQIVKDAYNVKKGADSPDTNSDLAIKYILNSTKDMRAIVLKVLDKLNDLKTFENIPEEYKKNALYKSLNIYGVLAEYMYMDKTKKKLEEKAFEYYLPQEYMSITKKMEELKICDNLMNQYKGKLAKCTSDIKEDLTIQGRIKNKYSIYNKLKKYEKEWIDPNINRLDDLIAFRIVTQTENTCFTMLEKLLDNGEIIDDRFDDYISNPKPNGYKALQFPIKFKDISEDINIEVQILTKEMLYNNKYGPASHIAYKASRTRYAKPTNKYDWVKEIQDQFAQNRLHRKEVKDLPVICNIFDDEVFVFTPKQKIIQLNKGDTVLDFAFKLHTTIGNSAVASKVNGKPQAMGHQLKTGDIVEIKVDKSKLYQKENMLQYAHSTSTKNKILKFINKSIKK